MGGRGDRHDASALPVYVLVFDAYGGGGVARTVLNLTNHLARHRDVELISLFRRRDRSRFPIDPRVRLTVLHDLRKPPSRLRRALEDRPTRLDPPPYESRMSLMTDVLLWRKLRFLRAGILLSTRPSLHLAAATLAPSRLVKIGQDHGNFETRFSNVRQANLMRAIVPRLDAFGVLTEEDAEDYARMVRRRGGSAIVRPIPNALPWPVADTPAPLKSKVVITAGRLDPGKGHARMIRAYATVARRHPDWQLHVYGAGSERRALQRQIEELGLQEQVRLPGYTLDLRSELEQASVYALTSHAEGFSMVLTEAMSVGLPLVSMDCPRGPRHIIRNGSNGMLVPDGDERAFAQALLTLIEDEELRRRLGAQGLEDAHAYEMAEVGRRWEELFADAVAARRANAR